MQPTTHASVAAMLALFGVLGLIVAALNVVALRVVRVDEVPRHVQARIRWWTAHNPTFLVVSALLTAAGLLGLATGS